LGAIRLSDLTQALGRIDRLQVKIDVRPPVMTYSKASRKLFLADPAFLPPQWESAVALGWLVSRRSPTIILAAIHCY
jgi:hypothetical protein